MSEQKWKLVPVEPTEEMVEYVRSFAGGQGYSAARGTEAIDTWKEMLAAAPQPPTLGGEPEVLAWMFKQHDQSPFGKPSQHIAFSSEELTEVREGLVGIGIPRDNYFDWQALVDRSHVTRLQAEVEQLTQRYDAVITDRNEVGSALEKAQSCIAELEAAFTDSQEQLVSRGKRTAELEGLLREYQWQYREYDDHYHKDAGMRCPSCGAYQDDGHIKNCDIGAALAEGK